MFLYGKLGKFLFLNDVFLLKKNSSFQFVSVQKTNRHVHLLSHHSLDQLRAGYPQRSAVIMWIVLCRARTLAGRRRRQGKLSPVLARS